MKKLLFLMAMAAGIFLTAEYDPVHAESMATVESQGLEDGMYTVEVKLEGGSGRTTVESPAALELNDGKATATIIFSSPNYDYMLVNGEKYTTINTEGNSTFEIPVTGFDYSMPVIADTVAMSEPHEIEYSLWVDSASIAKGGVSEGTSNEKVSVGNASEENSVGETEHTPMEIPGLTYDHSMELSYAEEFSVDYYEGGYVLVSINDSGSFLTVPEGKEIPAGLDPEITVLQQPLDNIYLVATSAMDLFRSIGGIENIRLSGTQENNWYIQEAKDAIANGDMLYAGKYNAPDYELILSEGCDLAVESTMIYHNPEVKEKLEQFGIPVLVERSSYEKHPLGRTEWMKLYAALLGKEEQAEKVFKEQTDKLEKIQSEENADNADQTVAFFFINSVGTVNVRKSNDYIANMINLAGGKYIPDDLMSEDNVLSTMNMQMEEFYAKVKDADYIIYNSTIDGELTEISQLLQKSPLMADFKAVKNGNVWCTGKNLFQETTGLGTMIEDIHEMLVQGADAPDEFTYMHRLK